MGAPQKAFDQLAKRLRRAVSARIYTPRSADKTKLTEYINVALDQWFDYRFRATEWDAERWGFEPDRWMRDERQQMENEPMIKGTDGRWYPTVPSSSAQ